MTCRSSLALLALAACNGGHHHGVDAPPIDVPIDTLQPTGGDPPATAIALYVTVLGAGAPNVPVYFQKPDSTVELAAVTDARGLAWALAGAGDFVTAIEPVGPTGEVVVTTFAGARPGDRLHLDLQPRSGGAQVDVTLHVPVQGGATGYAVHNPCGDVVTVDATGTGPVTFADCGLGTIDLVVTPLDIDGLASLGSLYAPGVAIAAGADVVVPGSYAGFDTTSFAYTNVPANVTFLGAYQAIVTARGRVFDASSGAQPSAGSAATSVLVPHTPIGTTALTTTTETPLDSELGQQMILEWRPWSALYSLDTTATRLPEYATAATFVLDTATVQWTERPGGTTPDFVRARVHLVRDAIPSAHTWTWRIVGPRTGTAIALPHLPNDGFDYNAQPGDAVNVEQLTNGSIVPGGYDAMRGRGFDDLTRAVTGGSGTIIVEDSYSPPL